MAYNEELADRVRGLLQPKPGFEMKKMFGGVCYLIHGNMACGVLNNDLIVRVGAENYEAMLKLPETRKFDTTGRPMKGWVMVSGMDEGNRGDLRIWVERGVDFARDLPPK